MATVGKSLPRSFPEDSLRKGESHASAASLEQLAAELVASGLAPSVAVGCAVKRDGEWVSATAGDVTLPFDLASLTKPMTAVAVARARGLTARSRLGELCPELADTVSGNASLEHLLSHRAGLVAHVPIYHPVALGEPLDPLVALRIAANGRREALSGEIPEAGFPPVYSDLGYALVGHALARHTSSRDAGEAIHRLVVEPLGLSGSLGTARELLTHGVDLEVVAPPTEEIVWRGGLIQGRVHDENAWALTGVGGSGHAGMFGTVTAVLRFAQAVLDALSGAGAFGAADLRWLVAERPGGTLRAGFDGKSPEGSSAGARFGPRSFGHLGLTGTSVWIDPDAGVVAALLTNRVHPCRTRAGDAIKLARPRVHDALHEHASSVLPRVRSRRV